MGMAWLWVFLLFTARWTQRVVYSLRGPRTLGGANPKGGLTKCSSEAFPIRGTVKG